ncbi:unnamed protein product [Penicillium nalgiovense]|uniref:Protein kinase domain-containing protein n=1 Tax=Penicillium nalgiovense TaxID=60175 RepID=A0A9W4MV50_PENNA|nr:unnamed protein product [Penicillium nalgiovense]CAG8082331.1 unnamed protein product [Penicillium nalgiovense]CAG8084826.1 unnamed protein product [Penicillium nalgiovense]CAG8088154.1 unnamed protein product [Penicillium nalgiovense]CAG8088193.1 unnamed protein product [Penicillium nalgiovense]
MKICLEYRNLEHDLNELIMTIEMAWVKMEGQLDSLRVLWDTIQPPLQSLYYKALSHLQTKIMTAYESVRFVHEKKQLASNLPRKAKVVYFKQRLKRIVSDLEEWQRRFDPSWYLITRIADPVVDKRLKEAILSRDPSAVRLSHMRQVIREISNRRITCPVFRSPNIIGDKRSPIPRSSAYVASYRISSRQIILDPTNFKGQTTVAAGRHPTCDLAYLLRHVEPMTFGLLKCEGVLEQAADQATQFQFIFEIPDGLSSPVTLRSLLIENPGCSLSQRIQIAKQLARSVMFVHTTGFVHKSIRPETIIVFHKTGVERLGPSFLIGFERVRKADGRTDLFGDLEWEKNLYRHPQRQGIHPEEVFEMRHDIYSLGVCLLEIAIWCSFVQESDSSLIPWSDLHISQVITDKDKRRGAFEIKRKLIHLSKDRLPSLVGDRYTEVVIACLCCLDDTEYNSFRYEQGMEDEDGVIVGVRYIENILLKLEELFI